LKSLSSPVPTIVDVGGDVQYLRKLYVLFKANGVFVAVYGGSTHYVDLRMAGHYDAFLNGDKKYFYECIRAIFEQVDTRDDQSDDMEASGTTDPEDMLPEYICFATVMNADYLEALETMMIMVSILQTCN
jgi:hypothetical protein